MLFIFYTLYFRKCDIEYRVMNALELVGKTRALREAIDFNLFVLTSSLEPIRMLETYSSSSLLLVVLRRVKCWC